VDMDKKLTAEKLLEELSAYHGAIIRQVLFKGKKRKIEYIIMMQS